MRIVGLGIVMLLCCLLASSAEACRCKAPPPPKEAAAEADAVFTGKVLKVGEPSDTGRAIQLEIESTWKGTEGKKITITTPNESAGCGFTFEPGQSYLIYAYKSTDGEKKTFETNLCTRTKSLDAAKEDLDALGKAKPVGR